MVAVDKLSRDAGGAGSTLRGVLLMCGLAASFVYIGTDVLAGLRYPGFSFRAQAVSELFAIGAPTSALVVPLFTLSSTLLLPFAVGVWITSNGIRARRAMAWMIVGNALDTLVLWNFFPMHMRAATPTFTDTMHLVFAANPFILATIVLGVAGFRKWFRFYSVATILILVGGAVVGFSYAPQLAAHQPTPWLGLGERVAQYGHQLWQGVLAVVLLTERPAYALPVEASLLSRHRSG